MEHGLCPDRSNSKSARARPHKTLVLSSLQEAPEFTTTENKNHLHKILYKTLPSLAPPHFDRYSAGAQKLDSGSITGQTVEKSKSVMNASPFYGLTRLWDSVASPISSQKGNALKLPSSVAGPANDISGKGHGAANECGEGNHTHQNQKNDNYSSVS